ncbi:MAG: glycosyltransferase family 4 protein [Candidatus Aenigmarchaeota archaeon]|nr:glycosyltransferase family 4 protein [Candidatus Aenigmarchaeota archaeon]
MTHILTVSDVYYPRCSGVSIYVQELCEELANRGFDISVYTPTSLRDYYDTVKGITVNRFHETEIYRAYSISLPLLKSLMKQKPDIIHGHHYGYFPATAGFLAAKKTNVPFVFSTHFHPPVYNPIRTGFFYLYHFTQGLPLLRFSDAVLPHTSIEKTNLCKMGAVAEKIKVLPSITDVEIFRNKLSGKSKNPIVLFVGPLIYEKGAHIFIDLQHKLPKNVQYVFVGEGYLENEIRKKIKNSKIFNKLPLEKLIEIYNKADIFVLPSMYEAFGRVLTEAQACEVPVVSTRAGGIPEVVIHNKTGYLVNYGEWELMAEYIKKLLDDSGLRRRIGYEGRKHVVKSFSKKVVVDKLVKIYERLL